jgi:hypothetical protein
MAYLSPIDQAWSTGHQSRLIRFARELCPERTPLLEFLSLTGFLAVCLALIAEFS